MYLTMNSIYRTFRIITFQYVAEETFSEVNRKRLSLKQSQFKYKKKTNDVFIKEFSLD